MPRSQGPWVSLLPGACCGSRPFASCAISPPHGDASMNRRGFHRTLLGALGAAMLPTTLPGAAAAAPPTADPPINASRLMEQLLQRLAEFGKNPEGGVSRVAYSDADRQGREYVTRLMREAALEVTVDAAGNIMGRRAGREPRLPALAFGSHIDSVPKGGNYD